MFWSHINPDDEYFVWKGMNDFRQIKFDGKLLQVEEFNRMYEASWLYLKKNREKYSKPYRGGYLSLAYQVEVAYH